MKQILMMIFMVIVLTVFLLSPVFRFLVIVGAVLLIGFLVMKAAEKAE